VVFRIGLVAKAQPILHFVAMLAGYTAEME